MATYNFRSVLYIQRDILNQLESIDAVNILPLARFEPTTSATSALPTAPLSHPQKKDVQEALVFVTTDAVHVVYWFFFNG